MKNICWVVMCDGSRNNHKFLEKLKYYCITVEIVGNKSRKFLFYKIYVKWLSKKVKAKNENLLETTAFEG